MTYFLIYILGIVLIWWTFRVGWSAALKTIISVLIPSVLIIFFNVKAGRLIFRSPLVGIISVLPTAFFIFRGSQPIVSGINSWIDRKKDDFVEAQEVVDAEVISKEDD